MTNHFTKYVLGFRFQRTENVVLIQKNRPQWQAGFFNGIGGHIEDGESSIAAMVREFGEETGMETEPIEWECYATLAGPGYIMDCYRSFGPIHVRSMTEENVIVAALPLKDLQVVPNLHWLIPMALDKKVRSEGYTTNLVNVRAN